ncbi:MAG: DUF4097 family beta strand repeat-containing protein [Chloroflexota bacterium]
MRRLIPLLALVALLASLLAGCTVNGTVQETEEERQSFQVGASPRVIVESFNGRISVVSGSDGTVEARVNKRGSGTSSDTAKDDLANVIVDFDQVGDRITITARRADPGRILGNSGADVDVTVPAASSVELRTQNGRVEAANVEGKILVRTSNGPITTRGGKDLDLDTTNGQIAVNNPSGRLSLRTSNGGIDILAAKEVSVVAETSNDPITFSGTLAPGPHSFTTRNGDIDLTLPGDAAFTFDGQTSNGSVRTEFGDLVVSDTSILGHTGKDPTPEVTVIARTSNGDLAVMTQKP